MDAFIGFCVTAFFAWHICRAFDGIRRDWNRRDDEDPR